MALKIIIILNSGRVSLTDQEHLKAEAKPCLQRQIDKWDY
jgi:hypothetical protein